MEAAIGIFFEYLFVYFTAAIFVVFKHGFKDFSMDKVHKTAETYWGRCVLSAIFLWFVIVTAVYLYTR